MHVNSGNRKRHIMKRRTKLFTLFAIVTSMTVIYVFVFMTSEDTRFSSVSLPPLNDLMQTHNSIVKKALKISQHYGTVLIATINDVYLPLAYNWLCNTKDMNIHKSVLIITTDKGSIQTLNRLWPEVNVVTMDLKEMNGHQNYSRVGYIRIMIQRTEIFLALLNAGVEIFLLEFDFLWLTNIIPTLRAYSGYDILVNPVAERSNIYTGGFMYLWPTDRTVELWTELTRRMFGLAEKISTLPGDAVVSENDNDQMYFSTLVKEMYGNIKVKVLPLKDYADGKWYSLPDNDKRASRPNVIHNNWIVGNADKIARAKKWGHWFIKEDNSCNMEQVNKVLEDHIPKISL